MATLINPTGGKISLPQEIVMMIVDEVLCEAARSETADDECIQTSDGAIAKPTRYALIRSIRTLRGVSRGFALACPSTDYNAVAHFNWSNCATDLRALNNAIRYNTELIQTTAKALMVIDNDKYYKTSGGQPAQALKSMLQRMPVLNKMILQLGGKHKLPYRDERRHRRDRNKQNNLSEFWGGQIFGSEQFRVIKHLEIALRVLQLPPGSNPLRCGADFSALLSLDVWFEGFLQPGSFNLDFLRSMTGLQSLKLETAPGHPKVTLSLIDMYSGFGLRMRKVHFKNVAIAARGIMNVTDGGPDETLEVYLLDNVHFAPVMHEIPAFAGFLDFLSFENRPLRMLRVNNVSSVFDGVEANNASFPGQYKVWCNWPRHCNDPATHYAGGYYQKILFVYALNHLGKQVRNIVQREREASGTGWTAVMEKAAYDRICPGAAAFAKLVPPTSTIDGSVTLQMDGQFYGDVWPQNLM